MRFQLPFAPITLVVSIERKSAPMRMRLRTLMVLAALAAIPSTWLARNFNEYRSYHNALATTQQELSNECGALREQADNLERTGNHEEANMRRQQAQFYERLSDKYKSEADYYMRGMRRPWAGPPRDCPLIEWTPNAAESDNNLNNSEIKEKENDEPKSGFRPATEH